LFDKDLDAIWLAHFWGLITHCARWSPWLQQRGNLGVEPPAKTRSCKSQPNRRSVRRHRANANKRFHFLSNYYSPSIKNFISSNANRDDIVLPQCAFFLFNLNVRKA